MEQPISFDPVRAPIDDPYELRGTRPDTIEAWDSHVVVDVLHDGARIPPEIEPYFEQDDAVRQNVRDAFVRERDWGASAVADRLAFHLGLRGYQNVQAARVACDYNRFRGWSVPEAGHLGRRALFPPGSGLMSPERGEAVLKSCYDPVTRALFGRATEAFGDQDVGDSRFLRVTVHTYDDRDAAGGRRPKTSLIFTPFEYHQTARLPANVYVPVFPDRLAEFTADRTLAYRLALVLERAYFPVAVNSPYFLPLGGAEMRLQVWCYLQHLRQQVQRREPETAALIEGLWPVIFDVDTPWGTREIDEVSRAHLDTLTAFVEEHRAEVVERYRYSAYRPSAIEVEVRKDVIWDGAWETLQDGADAFVPTRDGLKADAVDRVARVLADGIRRYLTQDQPEKRADAAPTT